MSFLIAVTALVLAAVALIRVNALSPRVALLEGAAASAAPPRPAPQPAWTTVAGAAAFAPAQAAATSATPAPPPAAEAPRAPRLPRFDWETLAGGRALNLVGAVVLIVGVGLFLKYAFDQNWIGPVARVLLGIGGGAALLAAADRLYARASAQRWFADGIAGAGLGILYLAGYAAFDVYHLIGFPVAYAYMAAVALASFAVGVRRDALAVCIVGCIGGFAAPLLGFGVHANEIGLGSYLMLLDIAILALAYVRQRWAVLEPLALAGTALVVVGQDMLSRAGMPAAAVTLVLLGVWFPFFLSAAARTLRDRNDASPWTRASVVASAALLWGALVEIRGNDPSTLTLIGLAVALGHAIVFARVLAAGVAPCWARAQWIVAATALSVMALHASLDAGTFSNALCFAGVLWIGADALLRRFARNIERGPELWCAGLTSLCVAQVSLVAQNGGAAFAPLRLAAPFDARDITIAALGAAWLFAVACAPRFDGAPRWVRAATRQAVALTLVYACVVHARSYELATALAVLGIVATALAARTNLRDVQAAGLCLLAAAYIPLLAAPDAFALTHIGLTGPFDARDLALGAELAGWIAAARLAARRGRMPALVQIGARQLVLATIAYGLCVHESGYWLAAGLAFTAAGAALAGTRSALRDLEIAALALLGIAFAGVLALPQTWEYARIFDFVPLRSERLLGSLGVLAALVLTAEIFRRGSIVSVWVPRSLRLVAAAFGVLTVTTEVRDVFALEVARLRIDPQTGAVLDAILRAQNGEQLAVTVAWIACSLALLAIGMRFRARDLRIGAVVLFDLTVLKAFFVDLAALDMPYRIVSFIGLGLVLLAVSYIYQRIERGRPGGRPGPLASAAA